MYVARYAPPEIPVADSPPQSIGFFDLDAKLSAKFLTIKIKATEHAKKLPIYIQKNLMSIFLAFTLAF